MRDYAELVERLRICPDYNDGCKNCPHEHDLGCRSTTMREAADAIEELQKSVELEYQSGFADGQISANRKKNRWISVEERLPEEGERVLILYELRDDEENISIGWLANGGFDCWDDSLWTMRSVTHWMPLPEPPREDDDA